MKRSAIPLIISIVFLAACTGPKLIRNTVVEQHRFIVTLEQHQKEGIAVQKNYAHPYTLDLAVIEKLLADLTYSKTGGLLKKKKNSPVFNEVEIERLAPALGIALAKADASQRIRFASFNNEETLIFSISRKTEGIIFIESDGQLNIAFNFINSDRHSSETSALNYSYSNVDPLKIKTSDTPLSSTAPYLLIHKFETGKIAPMWAAADLKKLKEPTDTVIRTAVKTEEDLSPAVTPKTKVVSVVPEKRTVPPKESGDMLKDIKNKLKYLKELRNEELITEKDYNAKKMELLDKIN